MTNVFAYGSLMYASVWTRVVAGDYAQADALLRGYARRRIRGEVYPALLAEPGGSVAGVAYLGVAPADLVALDQFEGEPYRRIEVPVELGDGRVVSACTYLYLRPDRVEAHPWDPERFERAELAYFLATYRVRED
jgi:gamma-glutamylcyclotransferase (GGCT)/AIG2-like uncharacterized protein YtfP